MNKIISIKDAIQYSWGVDCKAYVIADSINLSIKFETMPANSTEQLHYHNNAVQVFWIQQGNATFIIDDIKYELKPNQSITIYPKQQHFLINESLEELQFLIISQPNTTNDRINVAHI